MNNAEFWYEIVRTHEALFRQFSNESYPTHGSYDDGRREAYRIAAEALSFSLEDNKELAS